MSDSKPQSLTILDSALSNAEGVVSRENVTREEALAALANATAGMNAHLASSVGPIAIPSVEDQDETGAPAQRTFTIHWPWEHQGQMFLGDLESRLQTYFGVVKQLVDKLSPREYEVSIGLPHGLTVTFVWER